MEQGCFLFRRRLCVQLGGRLLLRFHHTNDIVGFLVVVGVLLLHILCRWLCFGVASHAPSACASAPPRGLAGMYRVGLLVGFISVAFCFVVVCDLNSNARQSPEGPPSVASIRLPIQFFYTLRLGALPIAFRVAGFGRADQTKFPWISPTPCDR